MPLNLTRRGMIQLTTAAGVSTFVLGRQSHAIAANDKMNIAIIGVNGRGSSHIKGFLADDRVNIGAIVDVDEAVGQKRCDYIEEKQGTRPTFYRDMREVYDDASITAMSTATPNHWHALSGVWAMQAGKDAYIEKPVCHNIQEGAALIAAARKYDRMCQVGTQCRSSQAVIDAMKFIEEGKIGEVKLARGLCYKRRKSIGPLGDYEVPKGVDFDLWSGPAEFTTPKLTRQRFHYDWHWQRHYGNGDFGNQGPHQTDIARWGLGVDTHPNSIISYGGRLGYKAERKDENYVDAGDTANTIVTICDYGDKTLIFETRGLSVDNSADEELNKLFGSTRGNKIGVVFYGSEGYLVQKSYTHCTAYDKDMNVIKEFKGGGDHFKNFTDACDARDRNVLNADVREGHLSAGISHLGNISYYVNENNVVSTDELSQALKQATSRDDNQATLDRTMAHLKTNGVDISKPQLALGALLKFNPEKEVFTNNDDANVLLGRTYRTGFVCPQAADV